MLRTRVLTAAVLAPLVIAAIFFLPNLYLSLFILFIITLAAWEWARLSGLSTQLARCSYAILLASSGFLLLHFAAESLLYASLLLAIVWWLLALTLVLSFPKSQFLWCRGPLRLILGFIVLLPMLFGLMYLKELDNPLLSNQLVLWLMFLVWGADSGAYFAGKRFGKYKLAPKVSPKKTWEGVVGGMLTAWVFSVAAVFLIWDASALSLLQWFGLGAMSVVVVLMSVVGDLFESLLKRCESIKDSSQLLPGHGGVMDRIDSLVAAVPFFVVFLSGLGLI